VEVELNIMKLEEAVDQTDATHEGDLTDETALQTVLETAYSAYADLTTAMKDLAASAKVALAAKHARNEHRKRLRRRQPDPHHV
jgi:hypothetical protein